MKVVKAWGELPWIAWMHNKAQDVVFHMITNREKEYVASAGEKYLFTAKWEGLEFTMRVLEKPDLSKRFPEEVAYTIITVDIDEILDTVAPGGGAK